jgi:hypothetical protein
MESMGGGRPGEPAASRTSEERAIAVGQKRDKRRVHRASSRSTCASDSGVFFTASATRARRERFRETRSASIDVMIFSPSHGVTLSLRAQKLKELGLFQANCIRPQCAGRNPYQLFYEGTRPENSVDFSVAGSTDLSSVGINLAWAISENALIVPI